ADAEEGVVIDKVVAAVEPVERTGDVGLLADINLVRDAETQHLAIPADRLFILRRVHDKMAHPLDVRWASLDAAVVKLIGPLRLVLADIDLWAMDRDFWQHRHPVDDLDLKPVRVGQANALAAARLVDVLDF